MLASHLLKKADVVDLTFSYKRQGLPLVTQKSRGSWPHTYSKFLLNFRLSSFSKVDEEEEIVESLEVQSRQAPESL